MSPATEARIDDLLTSWWAHEEMRRQGAPLAELYRSSIRLDEIRRELRG
ncbi:MAG: hypothetical protein AAF547_13555 [Actinomycetota bacterium]